MNLDICKICPRECGISRTNGIKGLCGAGKRLRVAKAALHFWEEPCLSGTRGSGAIFFSHCNLKCVFCQNYDISQQDKGKELFLEEFVEICMHLQQKGAHNINLVSPTHYAPLLKDGLEKARKRGLEIPVIYNSNGYEKVETLRALEGLIDIYLPDLKYFDDKLARKYSQADKYFFYASQAVQEMGRQVGNPVFDEEGIMKKGLLIRHLLLPGQEKDSRKILEWIAGKMSPDTYVSVMGQYTPVYRAQEYPELNKKITKAEYEDIIEYFFSVGLHNGFMQGLDAAEKTFIPDFDLGL